MSFPADTATQDKQISDMLKARGVDRSPAEVAAMSDMLRLMNPFCYCCFSKDKASMALCANCNARYYCAAKVACKAHHDATCRAAHRK